MSQHVENRLSLLFALLAMLFMSLLSGIDYPLTTVLKPLPIFCLIALAYLAPLPSRAKAALVMALGLASLGDIVLTLPFESSLDAGLLCFLLAHLCYIAVLRRIVLKKGQARANTGWPGILAALLLAAITAFALLLWPYLGEKGVLVGLYMLVISVMALLALHVGVRCGAGALLFVLSDSMIALETFVWPGQRFFFWIMLTYYLAQFLLVTGCLHALLPGRTSRLHRACAYKNQHSGRST
ncbi:MAG: lysoplasmalogenase [Legionellaceae bacterium]|nr:lysoplasmalogenase [Legionellaceae bacterium]